MMGHNDKLTKVFLIRAHTDQVASIEHPHHIYPPLPLKYMEALLKREGGFQVKLWDYWTDPQPPSEFLQVVRYWHPDIIVIFSNPVDTRAAFDLAQLADTEGNHFIVGAGSGPTLEPSRFLSSDSPFDTILLGEAEGGLIPLIKELESGNRFYKTLLTSEPILVTNLDSLPFPEYSLEELRKYRFIYPLRLKKRITWGFILSSRGCPHSCLFCSPVMRKTYGKKLRRRSAQNIVDEIEYLMGLGVNVLSFEDDDLTLNQEHILSLCREIKRRGLQVNWIAHARIDQLNPFILKEMKSAGCILLRLGVEAASSRIIKLLQKTTKNKQADWSNMCREVFTYCHRLGIATNALFILGNPSETQQEMEASIELAKDLKPDMIQVHFFTLYPGSPAYTMFQEHLPKEYIPKLHHYNTSINLSAVDSQELKELRAKFYRHFIFRPQFFLSHIYRYGIFYLCNPWVFQRLWRIMDIL
jgi:radical SAM superfamily enzyme YgiQ (UPF0313 family)